jgi:hypothetical protein
LPLVGSHSWTGVSGLISAISGIRAAFVVVVGTDTKPPGTAAMIHRAQGAAHGPAMCSPLTDISITAQCRGLAP